MLASHPAHRSDDEEKTAVILGPDGTERTLFHIGYGFEDIQAGSDGRIWVSYFDEGVYSGGLLPSEGLVAFDDTGDVVWRNERRVEISDCYALNVSAEGVWFCPYTDFELCRVEDDGSVTRRENPIHGAGAFAIHAGHVLFGHQYREPPGTIHLATIGDKRVGNPEVMQIAPEDGTVIPPHGVYMRGGVVHIFAGESWYRGHLSEIL